MKGFGLEKQVHLGELSRGATSHLSDTEGSEFSAKLVKGGEELLAALAIQFVGLDYCHESRRTKE